MDQKILVRIVRQFPQIWDRSHLNFRDREAKDNAWEKIGSKIGFSGESCREAFKSIREKYIREREKATTLHEPHREWFLLSELTFLDPNIVPRKQSFNTEEDQHKAEEYCIRINQGIVANPVNQTELDKALIVLVKKTTPIWDRNCNTYPNKQLKQQLWQTIAAKLNLETNACTLRWKALREKYIRQKIKYQQEGEVKWELLDDMNFLDKVIQYRKKQSEDNVHHQQRCYGKSYQPHTIHNRNNDISVSQTSYESEGNLSQPYFNSDMAYDSLNESSNDYQVLTIKQEDTVLRVADSSYNLNKRKRSISTASDSSGEKKLKDDEKGERAKSPEQLFGDLVAAMLSKKPESERNLYMIEIMTVLSK